VKIQENSWADWKNFSIFFMKTMLLTDRPVQLPAGNYNEDAMTKFANDNVKAYNKFLLAQVFRAVAQENVCKLLSHKDQTRLTVQDAYQNFLHGPQSGNGQEGEQDEHGQLHQRQ
jgi:hypothetical protein